MDENSIISNSKAFQKEGSHLEKYLFDPTKIELDQPNF